MKEERMDAVLEEAWEDTVSAGIPDCGAPDETRQSGFDEEPAPTGGEDEKADAGEVGADNTEQAQESSAQEQALEQPGAARRLPEVPKGEDGKEHPLLTRMRENARMQDMERFLAAYPEVKAADIPREVWEQTAKGVPLVSAYTMYENRQLKLQLAAERQDRLNRQRTPGTLGANIGGELDELDRMWDEDD